MLDRDEALKICETVLEHAKAAGAEDADVSVRSSIDSHARFADNRVTTSGRAEDVGHHRTVWVGRRRGAVTGNDTSAEALKQLAEEAVADRPRVAGAPRVRADARAARPIRRRRGFAAGTADVDVGARAAACERVLAACRAGKSHRRRFSQRASGSATAVATANGNRRYFRSTSDAGLSITARSADGTGSGYFAGDHFDLARLDAKHIVEQAVGKAVRSQQPESRSSLASIPSILEPQAVADLIGFLTSSLRRENRGRRAAARSQAKDGKTRVGEAMFRRATQPVQRPDASGAAVGAEHRRRYSGDAAVADQGRRAREPRILAILGAGTQARAVARAGQLHPREHAAAGARRDDMIKGMAARPADLALLVRAPDRPAHADADRADPRRRVVGREGRRSAIRCATCASTRACWRCWRRGTSRRSARRSASAPLMVPALKLAGFTFTSISDAI